MKRQQRTPGAFLKVPIDDEYHTYARILQEGIAFYDCRTTEEIDEMQRIASCPVLFITGVYNDVITQGHWLKVGKLPLEEKFSLLPLQYIYDHIGEGFKIYDPNTGIIRPSTKQECYGLECCAVWEGFAIEERLRDHYAGRECIWLKDEKELFAN